MQKVAVLKEKQDCKVPQIIDWKLFIPEHHTFMASCTFFNALSILDNYLEKTTRNKLILPPGPYKTSFDTLPPPKSLLLHCNEINKVKNEVHG